MLKITDIKRFWSAISKIKDFASDSSIVKKILKSKGEQKKIVFEDYGISQKQNEHFSRSIYDILKIPVPNIRIVYDENTKICSVYLICKCGEVLAIIEATGNNMVNLDHIMSDTEGAKLTMDALKLAQVMENPLDAFVYSCTECDSVYRAFINNDIHVIMILFALSTSFVNTIESFIKS